MHRQCPVSYNNSYAYGLTTYIIIVIVDPPVGLCTYIRTRMYVLEYLVMEHWRQDYSLSTMATVVDLSKGNTYVSGYLICVVQVLCAMCI